MSLSEKFRVSIIGLGIFALVFTLRSCESDKNDRIHDGSDQSSEFPGFITPNEEYFETRIGAIPAIAGDTYQLLISGAVDNPGIFSIAELRKLEMVERILTVECIGNPANGELLGTAAWKGFRVYDLVKSLGIKEGANAVKYYCDDGYFTFNSLEELQSAEVLGALYMNDEPIPAAYGFPLRIIFPGYYGVRHPGWIVKMEILGSEDLDYYSRSGWITDSTMAADTKIFFPANNTRFMLGDMVKIGGAAFGGRRISNVEITFDDGQTWVSASTRQNLDQDFVWIFWEYSFIPQTTGPITIQSRATASDGSVQPENDNDFRDGTNSRPAITIFVEDVN